MVSLFLLFCKSWHLCQLSEKIRPVFLREILIGSTDEQATNSRDKNVYQDNLISYANLSMYYFYFDINK